ncbi:MAG: hypothetical protein IPQ04_11725 [Saprospiraceae bacterium]|nr:hypothetical protein [Saprospiraceae bacterium]
MASVITSRTLWSNEDMRRARENGWVKFKRLKTAMEVHLTGTMQQPFIFFIKIKTVKMKEIELEFEMRYQFDSLRVVYCRKASIKTASRILSLMAPILWT